jgi:hypothetical protein
MCVGQVVDLEDVLRFAEPKDMWRHRYRSLEGFADDVGCSRKKHYDKSTKMVCKAEEVEED